MTTGKPAATRRARTRAEPAALPPTDRPFRAERRDSVLEHLEAALRAGDGSIGAHCVHELWMRGEIGLNVEALLARLWTHASRTIPEWLPMRYVEWLPAVYEVTARFQPSRRGRHNLYLVLLDYADSRADPHGLYVGMTRYSPADRFDQHKAGIRAAGSVLRRGLEVLAGPTLHLQRLRRAEAACFEEQLAEALRAEGLFVRGGH